MLTGNPGSEALRRKGPLLPIIVTGPAGLVRAMAMIDPGSSMSSVATGILRQIGAQRIGETPVDTITVDQAAGVYRARIASDAGGLLHDGRVLGADIADPMQVLIGRDILATMQFSYDGGGQWSLTDGRGDDWGLLVGAVLAGAGILWLASRRPRKRR